MFALIIDSDVVICDVTVHNANVFYELGIRHGLKKKVTILVRGEPSADAIPFDLLTDRYLQYDLESPAAACGDLAAMITRSIAAARETDSPVFKMLPRLREADTAHIELLPVDFREEVERARASTSTARGWLRLLGEEVKQRRFRRAGLELVANSQWLHLKDYQGARETFEAIREQDPDHLNANLALANIYERLFRETRDPALLTQSDQAIQRVLANGSGAITAAIRAEVLALAGRNRKTRWRIAIESQPTLAERRTAAISRQLIDAFDDYVNAFEEDLNQFYPGLAALQLGMLVLDLAREPTWDAIFGEDEGGDPKQRVEKKVQRLHPVVAASVEVAQRHIPKKDDGRVYADASHADLLFLGSRADDAPLAAYRDAIPREKRFAWDTARGQLLLFRDLGFKVERATRILQALDAHYGSDKRTPSTPVHLVLFAGHRVDEAGRPTPRLPESATARAGELIAEQLGRLRDDTTHEVVGLASAAAGADILFHEACARLGIPTTVCLPMREHDYARSFGALDGWRGRFLDLAKSHPVVVLSDRPGLPRWLVDSDIDPWERGNRWMMHIAEAWGAARVTLLALWDNEATGEGGGTARAVQLARANHSIRVRIIDSKPLLAPSS